MAVNSAIVEAYWFIDKRITEEEQQGKRRAECGKEIIKNLSTGLQSESGEGFAERCLWEYHQFYLTFIARYTTNIERNHSCGYYLYLSKHNPGEVS
jgi:hypothetical protein